MSVPEPRSFSLLITAPDVWVPVVETAEEPLSLEEVAEDTTLWAFQEHRPERRYFVESESNNLAFLEAKSEDLSVSEAWSFSLVTPFLETGLSESLELLEDYGEALNNSVFERRVEFFSVRDSPSPERASHLEARADGLALPETRASVFRAAPYQGIEGIVPLELSTLLLGLGGGFSEPLQAAESSSSSSAYLSTNSEPATLAEVGASRTALNDVVPDALSVFESSTSVNRFVSSKTESYPVVEASSSQSAASDVKMEARVVAEVGFDLLNRFGEEYRIESLTPSETGTEKDGFFHTQVEPIATVETRTSTAAWSHTGTEALAFSEIKGEGNTSSMVETRAESFSVSETSTATQKWTAVLTESPTFTEAPPADIYGLLQAKSEALAALEVQANTATWSFATAESVVVAETRTDFVARAITENQTESVAFSEVGSAYPGTADALHEFLDLGSVPIEEPLQLFELVLDTFLWFEGQPLVETETDHIYPAGTPWQSQAPTGISLTPSTIEIGQSFTVSGSLGVSLTEVLSESLSLLELTLTSAPTITGLSPNPVTVDQTFTVSGTV